MSDEILTTAALEASILVRSEEERLVELRVLPWNVIGRTREGPERFRRGAFRGTRPGDVALEAIGPHGAEPGVTLAGRAIELEDRDDGAYATFRVSRTRAGDELLELARDGVYRAASAVFTPITSRLAGDGVIERQAARLVRVGIVENGAYPGAEVLAVRSAGGSDVTRETNPPAEPDPAPDPAPEPPAVHVAAVNDPELLARMDDLRRDTLARFAALEASGSGRAGGPHPLARFARLADYLDAAYAEPLLARVLADQITSENPGVMQPAWLTEIVGILAAPRPAITALGGPKSLGDSGMELDWPYLDPAVDLDALVAAQAAEKTEIATAKVKILKGSVPITTFAGGSDVSYQLIRRSKPSYREAYARILAIAYARVTEARFENDLHAASASSVVIAPTATADQVRAAYFEASSIVDDATGSPATVVLASPLEFARLGGLDGLVAPAYGTQNVAGTAQASTLRINVSGLEVIRAPFLSAQRTIITNEIAAGWHEDGPFPISAEDVAKLGQNVAIWGMGATAAQVPTGIVHGVASLATRDAPSSGKR